MRISDWSSDVCSSDLLTQQKISELVDAECLRQLKRIGNVADGFRHFFTPVKQEAMSKDLFRQRQLCAHQEGGPVNGVNTNDILSDDMQHIAALTQEVPVIRSEELRAGTEYVSTCKSRWSTSPSKKTITKK